MTKPLRKIQYLSFSHIISRLKIYLACLSSESHKNAFSCLTKILINGCDPSNWFSLQFSKRNDTNIHTISWGQNSVRPEQLSWGRFDKIISFFKIHFQAHRQGKDLYFHVFGKCDLHELYIYIYVYIFLKFHKMINKVV